jgi:Sodium/hydrogen exchanger family
MGDRVGADACDLPRSDFGVELDRSGCPTDRRASPTELPCRPNCYCDPGFPRFGSNLSPHYSRRIRRWLAPPGSRVRACKSRNGLRARGYICTLDRKPLFKLVAYTEQEEVFTAMALLVALAAAWATGQIGLSMTLGAFLGGMAVAETQYTAVIRSEIKLFRGLYLDSFLSLLVCLLMLVH